MLRIILCFAFLLAAPGIVAAQDSGQQPTMLAGPPPATKVMIGTTEFLIPPPEGFSEASTTSEKLKAFGNRLAPSGTRMIGYFIPAHLVANLLQNIVPASASLDFYTIYLQPGYEKAPMQADAAKAFFGGLKADFERRRAPNARQADAFMKQDFEKLTKKAIFDFAQSMQGELPLEVYFDNPDAIATITLQKQSRRRGTEAFSYVLINTRAVTVAGGHPVFLNRYMVLNEAKNLGTAKSDVLNWAASVVRKNGGLYETKSISEEVGGGFGTMLFVLLAIIGSVAVLTFARRKNPPPPPASPQDPGNASES